MRNIMFASIFSILAGIGSADAATLDTLQWDYRVIAVFAPTAAAGRDAVNTLEHSAGIAERDIAWFVLTTDAIETNLAQTVTRDSLTAVHAGDGFEAVLLGKDGGVKSRQTETLDLDALFNAIDQMPMRQQEMQQQ